MVIHNLMSEYNIQEGVQKSGATTFEGPHFFAYIFEIS